MEKIRVTLGDFLKNAGIVGLKYMLEHAGAKLDEDYGLEEQALWISREFAANADWTDLYFNASVHYLSIGTAYESVLQKLDTAMERLENKTWKADKTEKDDLKFINEKLLSNSYQSGFENIRNQIEEAQIYERLKKDKLKDKMEPAELLERMKELKRFLTQPLCRETFCMKSIIYTYINRFWDGKCFLLRANAKKNMRDMFESDFSAPLKEYLKTEQRRTKDCCIDCNNPIGPKEKVSIAFMKDMADDLMRKSSAFWNCRVDAFLCPLCAFVYALSPLGFQQAGNKFIFINLNRDVKSLIYANRKSGKIKDESLRKEEEKFPAWFARLMDIVLSQKVRELNNIQIILRSTNADEGYLFSILGKDVLQIFDDTAVQERLRTLGRHPIVKDKKDFVNIYEKAILNIVQYRNQYELMNRLLKLSVETEGIIGTAKTLLWIQAGMNSIRKEGKGSETVNNCLGKMVNNGYFLRKELLKKKNVDLKNDECLRGTVYQLINALSVRNRGKFLEIVLRLYCSCQVRVPDELYSLLQDETFLDNGYAFLMGLKGSYKEEETK